MKKIKWWGWLLISIGVLAFAFVNIMFWGNYGHIKDADYNNPPVFITHDFVDLSKIDTISKFRSGMGHDYSGNGESCRSMRHYFGNSSQAAQFQNAEEKNKAASTKPDATRPFIEIYAPADGLITSISGENTAVGNQIEIAPKDGKGWHIRIDHVYPDGVHILSKIKAGQKIGVINVGQTVDMTIMYHYRGTIRLTSYFNVINDEVFAGYQARGAKARDDFIIPKEVVDASPWQCSGGHKDTPNFAQNYADSESADALNNFHLSGWINNFEENKKDSSSCAKDSDCSNGTCKIDPIAQKGVCQK